MKLSRPNNLRTLRRRFGLTQRELASLIGYRSESQVSRLERGTRMPGLTEAIKLGHLFNLPAATVFTRLAQTALKDLVQQVTQLNERLLRSGCLQPRVEYKAGQLADVLASLRNQRRRATGTPPWSITAVPDDSES